MKSHGSRHIIFSIFCMLILGISSLSAQVATSRIVGYNSTTCLGGSDTYVSVPFHQAPAYSGSLAANVTFFNASILVPASGTPGWTVDEFVGSHYVKFTSGAAAGLILEITANGAADFTVNPDGFGRLLLKTGDRFLIIPHWTLATLLPAATQTTLHPSTGDLISGRGSEVHFFEPTATGIDLAPEKIYYVKTSGWFQSDTGAPAAGSVIVPPHSALVIRHQPAAADTVFRPAAHVDVYTSAVLISTKQGSGNDNVLAIIRPIPTRLADLGFTTANFKRSTSNDPTRRGDELLIFDNTVAAQNKSETTRYFLTSTGWRLDNEADYPISDDAELPPGSVIVVRKGPGTRDGIVAWKNEPTY
ncbi:MAG: hypothetical protein ACI8UO_003633 [Verrucomicrobiales bacterium]|jgi:uncharacterized protein (TIGR02597 family)